MTPGPLHHSATEQLTGAGSRDMLVLGLACHFEGQIRLFGCPQGHHLAAKLAHTVAHGHSSGAWLVVTGSERHTGFCTARPTHPRRLGPDQVNGAQRPWLPARASAIGRRVSSSPLL